jgi:hypothetical protein
MAECLTVDQVVEGSSPFSHPSIYRESSRKRGLFSIYGGYQMPWWSLTIVSLVKCAWQKDIVATDRSVRTWLNELRQAELIDVRHRGQGKPNLYTVHLKAAFWRKNK